VRLHVAGSEQGDGVPVLLVHGFSSSHADWTATGWTQALERAGRAWIAPDLRGHGASEKPHQPADYRSDVLVGDLARTLDGCGAERADVVGYSLGAELALEVALAHPDRVRRLVAGGIGDRRPNTAEATATLYEHAAAGTPPPDGPTARMWSRASSVPGADPVALAACLAGVSGSPPLSGFDRFPGPTLLFAGTVDEVARGIETLREQLARAELVWIEGRNHFNTLSTAEAKERGLAFLGAGAA
jgi:pimeloyl-ACP methyl ester carboxylesterase